MVSLDTAWREVEEALPEGWSLTLDRFGEEDYTATAVDQPSECGTAYLSLDGPNPIAALLALAANLRNRSAPR